LKIIVSKIPEGGMNLQFEKEWKWFQDRLPEGEKCDFVLDRIAVACEVRRMKETVFIEGSATTVVETPCSRCLATATLPVSSSFRYTFDPAPTEAPEECELSAEDLEYAYYEEDSIDLDRLIFEQTILQIPIKPLCLETCRGLCPHCGINLNVAVCHCQDRPFDERLDALKQFKVRSDKP
jgi:uncharacterized protein